MELFEMKEALEKQIQDLYWPCHQMESILTSVKYLPCFTTSYPAYNDDDLNTIGDVENILNVCIDMSEKMQAQYEELENTYREIESNWKIGDPEYTQQLIFSISYHLSNMLGRDDAWYKKSEYYQDLLSQTISLNPKLEHLCILWKNKLHAEVAVSNASEKVKSGIGRTV